MAPLLLHGRVLHMPGSWGRAVPAQGVIIKIIDIDEPGNPDDLIFTGKTDEYGYFEGETTEWRDRKKTEMWVQDNWWRGHWEEGEVPDLTDALILQAQIKQGKHETKLQFVYVDDQTMSPPLIVPWGPPP